MLEILLAGVLASTSPDGESRTAALVQADPQADEVPTRLEDVVVIGRPLTSLIQGFVNEVAAPVRGRNLARWEDGLCVGVVNLRNEAAQYIVDRVSTVAEDLGLRPGAPGCRPNILIVATDRPDETAREMVDQSYRAFRPGGSGMDHGYSALRAFQESDLPVRWWTVSVPTNSDTGERAVRLPGECRNDCTSPLDMAPIIPVNPPSRLRTQIVDNLNRVIVIIDVNQVQDVSIVQLADYVAMVSLAQIDPAADTGAYATILNVFSNPDSAPSLTDWDLAYLAGLYGAQRGRSALNANRQEVVRSIRRSHEDLRTGDDG